MQLLFHSKIVFVDWSNFFRHPETKSIERRPLSFALEPTVLDRWDERSETDDKRANEIQ